MLRLMARQRNKMAADRFTVKHTPAQRLALVILMMQGVHKSQVCEAAGCAERTLLFWRERYEAGHLRADVEETKAALAAYQAALGCALVPPPSFSFAPATTKTPEQVVDLGTLQEVMQHGVAPRVATPAGDVVEVQPNPAEPAGLRRAEPATPARTQAGQRLEPARLEPAGERGADPHPRRAGKVQGSLAFGRAAPDAETLMQGPPPPAPQATPSEVAALVEDDGQGSYGAALPTEFVRHTGHQDGLDVLQSYSSSVVFRLMQIGEALASNKRLPAWQLQQLRGAADIFKHLSSMITPKTKPVAYAAPARASAARKDRGEVLFALGELLERANTSKDVEAIEGLVHRIQAGEITFGDGGDDEPVQ